MCKVFNSFVFVAAVASLTAAVMSGANPQAAKPSKPAAPSTPPAAPAGKPLPPYTSDPHAKDPGPSYTLGAKPPMMGIDDKTVVLFDGKDMSHFTDLDTSKPSGFKIDELKHIAIAGGGDTVSKENFGDFQMHVEFLCPVTNLEGQARSNSGVYIHGRYEIQVLDTFGMPPADNYCGGIYKVATPLVGASRPPGEWQTYDVTFRAPRFGPDGGITEKPRVTVLFNGIIIHNNVELASVTAGGIDDKMVKEGPLLLQFHGDPVQYRNIWVRKLIADTPVPSH